MSDRHAEAAPAIPAEPDRELRTSAGTIRYREAGSGEPIVFVHGFLVDGTLWADTARELSSRHRCIVPDLPFGSHRPPMSDDADLSPPGVAQLIDELLAALDLDGATLVGNDTGGAMCQLVVTRHPDRVARLVLTNCDAFENFPPKGFRYLGAVAKIPGGAWAMTQSMRLEVNRRSPLAFGRLTKRRIPGELLERWVRPSIEDRNVRRDMRKLLLGVSPDYTLEAATRLGAFERPALLAWAPEDPVFPLDHAERLATILPDSRLELIEDSRAFVSLDQPQRLAEAISAFAAG